MIQRALLACFFVFALLLAQQGGAFHGLSHLTRAPTPADQHVPHGKACADCLVFAEIGAAVAPSPAAVAPAAAPATPADRHAGLVFTTTFSPYRSRAPPEFHA